jgi:hypothetical protein
LTQVRSAAVVLFDVRLLSDFVSAVPARLASKSVSVRVHVGPAMSRWTSKVHNVGASRIALPTPRSREGQCRVNTKMKKINTTIPAMTHTRRMFVLIDGPRLANRIPRLFDASSYPRDNTEPSRKLVKKGAATITKAAKNWSARGRTSKFPWWTQVMVGVVCPAP